MTSSRPIFKFAPNNCYFKLDAEMKRRFTLTRLRVSLFMVICIELWKQPELLRPLIENLSKIYGELAVMNDIKAIHRVDPKERLRRILYIAEIYMFSIYFDPNYAYEKNSPQLRVLSGEEIPATEKKVRSFEQLFRFGNQRFNDKVNRKDNRCQFLEDSQMEKLPCNDAYPPREAAITAELNWKLNLILDTYLNGHSQKFKDAVIFAAGCFLYAANEGQEDWHKVQVPGLKTSKAGTLKAINLAEIAMGHRSKHPSTIFRNIRTKARKIATDMLSKPIEDRLAS